MWNTVLVNARIATMQGGRYAAVHRGAIAFEGDGIAWIGEMRDLSRASIAGGTEEVDVEGRWVTPGLVDCHTHLVYAGNRAREFELRLEGATYEDIARAGGGIVSTVEATLLTPAGLRTLAPSEPGFAPRYEGGPRERDAAYHQGTVWPWLLGAFVDAWLRVHGDGPESRATARRRFFDPLVARLDQVGLGHVSEIADATDPFTPRGCPFQAWSVGEAIRIDRMTSPDGC